MENRLKNAIEFLKDGLAFRIGDLRFELEQDNHNHLIVSGWSQYLNFASLTKETSMKELCEIKSVFSDILEVSKKFRSFIDSKIIEYKLCFDDGGKASIDICSEKDSVVKWLIKINP